MTTTSRTNGGATGRRRETIARYDSYPEAEAAVDRLAAMRFPVERVSIVGEGLRMVERVTRRTAPGSAIGSGALGGALLGAVFGWFLGLFGLTDPLVHGIVLGWWGLVIGAALGAIVGAVMYLFTQRRRGFESTSSVEASAYCIVTDADVAERGAALLRS